MTPLIVDEVDNVLNHKLTEYAARFLGKRWSYLEIGCREGGSLSAVIRAGEPGHVTIIDSWGPHSGGTHRGSHDHIVKLLADLCYGGSVTFMDGLSEIQGGLLFDSGREFDIVLVDAAHDYPSACVDLFHTWPIVKPGGYLVLDDIVHPNHLHLQTLANRFSEVFKVNPVEFITDIDYGVAIWKK